MAKFVIVGDIQFRGVNPIARKDNFMDAIIEKIDEVHQIAKQIGAAAILTPGDLFDSPMVSYSVLLKLMAILQKAPCPWVTIPGNHDLFGSNIDTYTRTPMAVLEQAGVVQVLDGYRNNVIDLSPSILGSIITTGRGFDWEMDTHPGTYAAPGQSDIHMTHGMLVTTPLPYEIKHTLIKDVQTEARVTICGHEHLGFGIIKRDDGKWFINPGALCRESASEAEIQRQVQVAILEIEKNASTGVEGVIKIKAELVPITCARPAEEVLSREHIEAQTLRKERMDYFLELLAWEGEGRFLEVREIIDCIVNHESLPESVRQETLKRIAAAREELAGKILTGRVGV